MELCYVKVSPRWSRWPVEVAWWKWKVERVKKSSVFKFGSGAAAGGPSNKMTTKDTRDSYSCSNRILSSTLGRTSSGLTSRCAKCKGYLSSSLHNVRRSPAICCALLSAAVLHACKYGTIVASASPYKIQLPYP